VKAPPGLGAPPAPAEAPPPPLLSSSRAPDAPRRAGSWLLSAYAFFLPVQVTAPLGLRWAVSDGFVVAYLLLRGARLRRVGSAWSGWHYALVAVLWSGLLVALANTGRIPLGAFLAKALGILVLLATFAALVDGLVDWRSLRRVFKAFLLGALWNGAAGVLAFGLALTAGLSVPFVNAPYETSRVTGFLIDPNAFGGFLATALLLHVCTTAHGTPLLSKWPGRVAELVFPIALLATFSRSAWIGAGAGVCAVLVIHPRFGLRVLGRLTAPLVIGVVLGSLILPNFLLLVSRPEQVQGRVLLGQDAVHDFLASPLLGTGLGVFSAKHGIIVHNTVLWFLTEMGLVGFVILGGLLVSYVRRGLWTLQHCPDHESGLVLGLLAGFVVVLGLSLGIEAMYQRYWWLLLAGLSAAYALRRQRLG
jgi:hypothetical protein